MGVLKTNPSSRRIAMIVSQERGFLNAQARLENWDRGPIGFGPPPAEPCERISRTRLSS